MDEHVLQYYLHQVPAEIREAVMELDTHQKWAVYIALTVEGDKYFNELKKQFKANPKTLNDVLKSLVAGGLVDRKVKRLVDVGDTNRNYYSTTRLGEKLLMNLYETVLPPLTMGPKTQIRIPQVPTTTITTVVIPPQKIAMDVFETTKNLEIQMVGEQA